MTTDAIRKILTRDFILLFFSQFAFTTAHHMLVPTLPVYLSQLESRETEIGILIATYTFFSLLMRPLVGKALSKNPEKKIMILGGIFFSLASFAYIWAPPFWPFFLVRVFQGIGYAFFFTASFTLIANISPEAHRGQSLSYFLLAMNLSLALGPSFGMFLINRFGFSSLFLVCFGLSASSLFITKKLGRRPVTPKEDPSITNSYFLSREALPPSVISFFFFLIWGALTAFFPLYAIHHGMANPGFFFTTIAVMLISGRVLGGRISDLYSTERVILLCLIA
ncbi:MAG TPA: MFS transporter, partial [bacterium]|nr:MFS transporter [bacterium]